MGQVLPEGCRTQVAQALDGLNDNQGMEGIVLCCTQQCQLAGPVNTDMHSALAQAVKHADLCKKPMAAALLQLYPVMANKQACTTGLACIACKGCQAGVCDTCHPWQVP